MNTPHITVKPMRDPETLRTTSYPELRFVRAWRVYADDARLPGAYVGQTLDGRMYGIRDRRTHVVATSTPRKVAFGTWRRTEGASC